MDAARGGTKNLKIMRPLTNSEISQLQNQHCSAENWQNITVAENFFATQIYNVSFSGKIILGENLQISRSEIANYHIKNSAIIKNVNLLAVEGKTAFGNGTEVSVLNEAGGREVKIFDRLSAHVAYILAMYRHRPQLIEKLNLLIDKYAGGQSYEMGEVGENAKITNCGIIQNVKIGNNAQIENVAELKNGTVCEQAFVGTGVIARHFIIGKGSKVYDYALLEKTFVGESCEVGKQYSATDSLIFCNSQLLHGEAAAVFAGAYTTSHHKSTLLIGSMFSFYNAGSGSNQSNHMYKLGPVHQGIFERGVKTGSDSYLMLAARAGAFSLVLGHHEAHFDSSDLPFSYILIKEGRSELIPAINFQTVGTQRDSQKWKKRDNRTGDILEHITFDLLNPYIINKIKNGIAILEKMSEKPAEHHSHKGLRIKDIYLERSIKIYRSAIVCYLGEKMMDCFAAARHDAPNDIHSVIAGNEAIQKSSVEKWIDLAGLIIPQTILNEILLKIENNKINSIEEINLSFSEYYKNYSEYEMIFVKNLIQEFFPNKTLPEILELYAESLQNHTDAIVNDAEKEFNAAAMVGFGIDGDEEMRQADFQAVRGSIETNDFIAQVVEKSKKKLNYVKNLIQK